MIMPPDLRLWTLVWPERASLRPANAESAKSESISSILGLRQSVATAARLIAAGKRLGWNRGAGSERHPRKLTFLASTSSFR